MDYQIDADFIYLELSLGWNLDLFWIDEGSLNQRDLAAFKAVIVTEPCVPAAAQASLLQWAKAGGTLITTLGAAS